MQVMKREKRMFNYIVLTILITGVAIAAWLLWYPK